MITTVNITMLSPQLRELVLSEYRQALRHEDVRLTYMEAAWLYGYTYWTIRYLVCKKRMTTVGRSPNKRIKHAAMRRYIASLERSGRPRVALSKTQLKLN